MSQTLDANLNIIAQDASIEIEYLDGDLRIIAKLDDEPNDVGGLTAAQLKAKFDEAGVLIQEYINTKLIPAILEDDATEAARTAAESERMANEVQRVAAEKNRAQAEKTRDAAELERKRAELEREAGAAALISRAENAASTAAKSWAEGGTGTRTNEETTNAKYWAGRSQGYAEQATVPAVAGVYNIILQDRAAGTRHALILEDGLMCCVQVRNTAEATDFELVDTATGSTYVLGVDGNRLYIEEVT